MREIKFRAWDKKDECFRYLNKLSFDANGEIDAIICEGEENDTYIMLYPKNSTLMQYIGLKDKNGKEIYEGDCVKFEHPHKNRSYVGNVYWSEYEWNVHGFNFPHYDNPYSAFSEGTEYCEIIGNTYEGAESPKEVK